ncbi:MAG: diguanylate cyclase/phosphodiesterase with sensor [Frankiales bacterium]|nr:diguanylate cyclase/phosphodiesterase with sensor [Frankiales bacterium]
MTPPAAPGDDASAAAGLSGSVRPLLQVAAAQAGLDGVLLARQQGDRWVVLETSSPGAGSPVGTSLPWDSTLCAVVVRGAAPTITPDLDDAPLLRAAAAQHDLQVGGFVSLPLHDADGRLLGTVCGWSATPLAPDVVLAEPLLRALADACAGLLVAELALTASRARADLLAPDADLGHHTGLLTPASWAVQLGHHDERCARLGATASVLLVELRETASSPDVLLALLAGLHEGDALTRLPGGVLALLLVDAGGPEVRRRALQLTAALQRSGVAHRTASATAAPGTRLRLALRQAEARLGGAGWRLPDTGAPLAGDDRVRDLLDQVRRQLGQDVAYLSQRVGGQQRFREVVAPEGSAWVAGDTVPLEDTLCQRILAGELPAVMSDVRQHPAALEVPSVQQGLVGGYLAAPVRLSDGRLYGTLCCLTGLPLPGLSSRDLVVLQVVADALGEIVEAELEATSESRLVAVALANLMAAGGPIPVYQPVVATGVLDVVGMEALTRFPDGRSPLVWFAEAAGQGRGVELELAACRAALPALGELAAAGRFLAVNLSPAALADPGLEEMLAGVRAEGLLGALVVEITEHEAVDDYDALNRLLAPWRAAGLRLAIDDTGAGHSSLRHVLLLEPDIIKLDRELITAVEDDPTRADLVASLVAFADRSGRMLVAEGVETSSELACLTGLGVHLVQGFYLARPLPELVTRIGLPTLRALRLPAPRSARGRAASL